VGGDVLHESTWRGEVGGGVVRVLTELGMDPDVSPDRMTFRRPFPGSACGMLTDVFPGDEVTVIGPRSDPRVVVRTTCYD
jgi:hypothetical protein